MDVHSKAQRSRNMSAIRNKDTKIELILGKALWAKGYRYRKNNKKIIGRPDFTFTKYKIAIFCDSEFFHGKDWDILKNRIGTNNEFWVKKIQSNIDRDFYVNEELRKQGWTIIRFWGNDIKKNKEECIQKIENTFKRLKRL